jgi:hypothetical protein
MNRLCEGLDEATASSAPEGRWTPKMILSHLCGPEEIGILSALQVILQQDTPLLEMDAENPYYTGNRSKMTFSELWSEFQGEYGRMAALVETLSDAQLDRKAHIPLFKELPMGEYPTLAMFVQALVEFHLVDHIDHMKDILQGLGVALPA